MKMILLFSHRLTTKQIEDAKVSLGVNAFVYLPDRLQALWSQIPSDLHDITPYLTPIQEYLQSHTYQGDLVLIQGDFGATYTMVNFAKSIGLKPIYSTNERQAIEQNLGEEVHKRSIFIHSIYREY